MKKTLLQSLLLILLTGCVVPDPDPRYGRRDDGRNTGNVSRVAERDCINMARDRGYRDAVVDSSQWQGDEYAVSVSEHVPGPNPTMNCVYNPGSGRTRVVSSSQGNVPTASRGAERECMRLARDRGYRDPYIDSSDLQGDEWVLVVSEHRPGPNPTMRCLYNERTGRARVGG